MSVKGDFLGMQLQEDEARAAEAKDRMRLGISTQHEEHPKPLSTPVSGTDGPAEVDGGTATEVFAETAKPRRGRRRGPARETHAITVPAELWQEWVEMAERHDTNVSFMIEDVMRRKGRKLYE